MLFEAILTFIVFSIGIILIGIPCYKLIKAVLPSKRNPLAEAKERLEQARLEAEAARLNKETEKLYEQIYEETLEEDNQDRRKYNG